MLKVRPSSDDARRRLAKHEAERLADKLKGLEPRQLEMVIREFLLCFLKALVKQYGLDPAALLRIAQIPLDLVIEMNQNQEGDGGE